MSERKIETVMGRILPREEDEGPVMNVDVTFSVPEEGHRNNIVEVGVFVDKAAGSIDEIRRVAVGKAIDALKKIIAHHS